MIKKKLITEVLITKNIDDLIEDLKDSLNKKLPNDFMKGLLVPFPHWSIDRKKYKGIGRPRKKDYIYIDFLKTAKDILKNENTK